MRRVKTRVAAAALALAVTVPFWASSTPAQGVTTEPNRVLIVLFDQMVPKYADQFNMPNFRALRGQGTYFKNAYLGYMASETVISHNVIVSGQLPATPGLGRRGVSRHRWHHRADVRHAGRSDAHHR